MIVDVQQIEEAKIKIGAMRTAEITNELLQLGKFDERNLKACCPFHEEKTPSFVLNPKTMYWKCFGCGASVDIIDVYMHTGMTFMQALQALFKEADMQYSFGEVGIKTKHEYRYPKEEPLGDKSKVYQYLEKRKISRETVDYADVRQDKDGNCVFNFYDTNDVLTLVKYRPSHKIEKSSGQIKTWCQKGADTAPILFNMNRVNVSRPLVITEGELDAMSFMESGYRNVVSIPLGSQNSHWIEENFDWLEQFTSIIICFDNDKPGIDARKEAIPRLGSWRCKFIDIPHEMTDEATGRKYNVKDVNEVLYRFGKEKVMNLLINAKEVEIPSIVDFSDVKEIDIDDIDGINTGISCIDEEIMKLFYGTLTVLSGNPGSGKTSIISQIVCQALEEEKNVWFYGKELPNWMQKNWIDYILAGGHHLREYISSENARYYKVEPRAKQKISEYYKGRCFLYRDDWSNKFSDVMQSMEDAVRKNSVKLCLIDNLMMLDLNTNENNMLIKQTECVNELIKFALKFNVAIILVAHPRKLPQGQDIGIFDVAGSSNINNLAHRTLALRRTSEKDQTNYDVFLTIVKDRIRGKAGKRIGLYYDIPSRRFYTNENEYERQYSWDEGRYDALPYPHEEEYEVYGVIVPSA